MIENCHQGADGPGVEDPNVGKCTGLGGAAPGKTGSSGVSDCPFNFWRTTGDPEPGWGTIMRELNTLRKVVNANYPSGKRAIIALEKCDGAAPEQIWNVSGAAGVNDVSDASSLPSVATLHSLVGGCLEINGCCMGDDCSLDTTQGCKSFPKPGDHSCNANMAWALSPQSGTISSVMSGKCITASPSAGTITVATCSSGNRGTTRSTSGGARDTAVRTSSGDAGQAWEVVAAGGGGGYSTIREKGGQKRCMAVRTLTPSYNVDPPLSRPGGWAYPGTMTVGDGTMTLSENQVHMGGWCIVSSPLVLAFNLSDATRRDLVWNTITNKEAIQVNQIWDGEPGAQRAHSLGSNGAIEVWTKRVGSGRVAAFFINTENGGSSLSNATVTLDLVEDLNITVKAGTTMAVRDVWAKTTRAGGVVVNPAVTQEGAGGKTVAAGEGGGAPFTTTVPHHGSRFFVFVPEGAHWPDPFELAPWMKERPTR